MSRKFWIVTGSVLLALIVMAAVAGGGLWIFLKNRDRNLYESGQAAYENENWGAAKTNFQWYLLRTTEDNPEVLRKLADASSRIISNREQNLQDAAGAYFQIARNDLTDFDAHRQAVEFMHRYELWADLEWAAQFLLDNVPDHPDADDLRYYEALAKDRQGRPNDAVEAYRALIEQGTEHYDVYGNLALRLAGQGYEAQARELLESAVEQNPDNAALRVGMARLALAEERLDVMWRHIDEALALDPDDHDALLAAAQGALASDEPERALDYARRALEQDPADRAARLAVVFSHTALGQNDEALAVLDELDREALANSRELILTRAELQAVTEEFDAARESIELFRQAYPNDLTLAEYLEARVLLGQGEAEDAVRKLTRTVEGNPNFRQAQYFLAVALLQAGNERDARLTLDAYLTNYPDDQNARNLFEQAFRPAMSEDQLRTQAKDLLAMSEPLPASLLQTAQGLIQAAERRGAEGAEEPLVPQLLERAIEQNPRLPTPYELLASYYIVLDEYDQAGAVIDRGEAAGIEEGEFRNVRAAVATEAGRIDEAFGLFEAVLADEAPSAQTVSQWANFFGSRGHMDTAMRVVNSAAAEATDTEEKAAIRLLEVPLLFTAGRPGEALERFDALEAELAGEPLAAGELARTRVLVAERLIADDATANRERIEQLLAAGEDDADSAAATKVLRARLALQQEEPEIDQAIALAQEALAADSTDVGAHLVLYRAALARGELSEALAHAREAAGLDPAGTAAQLALAEALMRNDRMNEAAQTLESLVAAQPGNPDALRMLTRAYVFTDRPGLATSTLARLEERNQGAGAIDLGDLRTLVAAHGTDRQAAEEALRGQLESNPDDFTSLSELTRLLGEQGRVDEAQDLLDTYTAQYPDSPEVWAIAGQYYLQHESDDPTAASSAFQEALTLRPDYGPALKGLIEVQIRTRSVGTALGLANRYLQRQPGDPDILFLKARILSDNPNQREEAITAINQAIEADPRPEYYSLRGSLHLQAGNHQLALDDLRRFEQAVTGVDPRLSASLAEAYLGVGEPERALSYFREAEERANPNDTALLNRLAAMRAAFPAETTP